MIKSGTEEEILNRIEEHRKRGFVPLHEPKTILEYSRVMWVCTLENTQLGSKNKNNPFSFRGQRG